MLDYIELLKELPSYNLFFVKCLVNQTTHVFTQAALMQTECGERKTSQPTIISISVVP